MSKEVEIIYKSVILIISGYYTPAEEEVRYYSDGSGHPGSPAEFNCNKVTYNDVDVTEIYNSLDLIGEIEILTLEKYEER